MDSSEAIEFNKFVKNLYYLTLLLSKVITVEQHLTGCKMKQYIATMLRKEDVPLTPEQFMLIDFLGNSTNDIPESKMHWILHQKSTKFEIR